MFFTKIKYHHQIFATSFHGLLKLESKKYLASCITVTINEGVAKANLDN